MEDIETLKRTMELVPEGISIINSDFIYIVNKNFHLFSKKPSNRFERNWNNYWGTQYIAVASGAEKV